MKSGLPKHPLGAAIGRDPPPIASLDQLAETFDCLRLTAQLVVELHHFGDQAGPDPKRQIRRRLRTASSAADCAIASRS